MVKFFLKCKTAGDVLINLSVSKETKKVHFQRGRELSVSLRLHHIITQIKCLSGKVLSHSQHMDPVKLAAQY